MTNYRIGPHRSTSDHIGSHIGCPLPSLGAGGPRRSIAIPFSAKKREWCGYPMAKIAWCYVWPFRQNTGVWRTDGWTPCDNSIVRVVIMLILTTTETGGRTTFNVSKILRTRNDIWRWVSPCSNMLEQHTSIRLYLVCMYGNLLKEVPSYCGRLDFKHKNTCCISLVKLIRWTMMLCNSVYSNVKRGDKFKRLCITVLLYMTVC